MRESKNIKDLHGTDGIIEVHQKIQKDINLKKYFFGIFIFILIFVIIIPIILYKYKYFTLLEGYLPNVDMIANSLSWNGGPFGIWDDLYPTTPLSIHGFLSQSFINYIALLGLTYIIARETKLTKSILKGWTIGFVMILMTYLLPSNLITHVMNIVNDIFNNKFISVLVGLSLSILIIILESSIIKIFRNSLMKLGKKILNFPKKF